MIILYEYIQFYDQTLGDFNRIKYIPTAQKAIRSVVDSDKYLVVGDKGYLYSYLNNDYSIVNLNFKRAQDIRHIPNTQKYIVCSVPAGVQPSLFLVDDNLNILDTKTIVMGQQLSCEAFESGSNWYAIILGQIPGPVPLAKYRQIDSSNNILQADQDIDNTLLSVCIGTQIPYLVRTITGTSHVMIGMA